MRARPRICQHGPCEVPLGADMCNSTPRLLVHEPRHAHSTRGTSQRLRRVVWGIHTALVVVVRVACVRATDEPADFEEPLGGAWARGRERTLKGRARWMLRSRMPLLVCLLLLVVALLLSLGTMSSSLGGLLLSFRGHKNGPGIYGRTLVLVCVREGNPTQLSTDVPQFSHT